MMVQVVLWGSLKSAAGGATTLEIEARTIRELLTGLEKRYPGLQPILEEGVSVAIDGQIYREAWFQPIPPESEVYLLPAMAGG